MCSLQTAKVSIISQTGKYFFLIYEDFPKFICKFH